MESIRCLTPEDSAATDPIVALATLQECEFTCSGLAYAEFPYFLTILVAYHYVLQTHCPFTGVLTDVTGLLYTSG